MIISARIARLALTALVAVSFASGCDDSNGSTAPLPPATASPTTVLTNTAAPAATATPIPSGTPAPTSTATQPRAATVAVLAVLSDGVASTGEDALSTPPSTWMAQADSATFARAFSHADWTLQGVEGRNGTTGADGSFTISNLAPGAYILDLHKTLNGNLVSVTVPLTVGDDGGADVLIQIDLGRVRSAATYTAAGKQVRDVAGPDASRVVIENGQVVTIRDPSGEFVDPDGDGRFATLGCTNALWLCAGFDDPCGDGRRCQCTASCPLCEDCGPPVCTPPLPFNPYRCAEDGGCAQPGDVCTCVSSCPDCDDCALSVCVPACEPAAIVAVRIEGAAQVVAGRRTTLRALAELDNGNEIDVTYLAQWASSDTAVASVDSWGNIVGLAVGATAITATFNEIPSAPHAIAVVERAGVSNLEIHIQDCVAPYGRPVSEVPTMAPAMTVDAFPYPVCREVVRVGRQVQLIAFASFADGTFDVVTDQVAWAVEPTSVARIDSAAFVGISVGTAQVSAALGGVSSNDLSIRVVDQATVVQLSIHPEYGFQPPIFLPFFADDPTLAAPPADCFDCFLRMTLLIGDSLRFRATARYDTGDWEEVTEQVTWSSSDGVVAPIDAAGELSANAVGTSTVSASLGEVASNDVVVDVVAEATLSDLSVYPEGQDRTIGKGGEAYFRAQAYYDVGFGRDVTDEVTWHSSDPDVGSFAAPGVFTGHSAGAVQVWASLVGGESNRLPMSVFETSDISYCDPDNINRGTWSDAFNRVILESNCDQYTPPDVVELRFTVTERERPIGIFDPCLDLYVYQGSRKIRTIREQGCGEPFLAPGAPGRDEQAPRFQLKAFWDLKDDAGNLVPPGVYTVHGRFYLYFDPVVSLQIGVTAPDGLIPCTTNDCGNGCGYVRTCGDSGPPLACPAVCMQICECPIGWGITDAGGCERCENDCCRPGEVCPDTLRTCEPACCAAGEDCDMGLPPCTVQCCPPNARCTADIPPCETGPNCCPPGQACADLLPCESDCCPTGALCAPGWVACDEVPPPCVVTGCSGQVCAASHVATTCEFLPEFACYQHADCGLQANGSCGWTPSGELQRCLAEARAT